MKYASTWCPWGLGDKPSACTEVCKWYEIDPRGDDCVIQKIARALRDLCAGLAAKDQR